MKIIAAVVFFVTVWGLYAGFSGEYRDAFIALCLPAGWTLFDTIRALNQP